MPGFRRERLGPQCSWASAQKPLLLLPSLPKPSPDPWLFPSLPKLSPNPLLPDPSFSVVVVRELGGVESGGASGGAEADDGGLGCLAHAVAAGPTGAMSAIRPSTRVLISSRMGRTASMPWPAGSSSFQSR